jgi:WD40 repeat protein
MWDTQTGNQIKTFDCPGVSVTALGFSSDGKSFIVGGSFGTLHLYNSETGEIIQKFYGQRGGVMVAFQAPNDQKLFVAYESGPTVTEWDIAAGTETRTFREVREGVRVAWAVDGKTRSWWSTESGSQVPGEFEAHASSLTSTRPVNINISPDGKKAFTLSVEGGMASVPSFQGIVSEWARLWDMETGELIWFSREFPGSSLHKRSLIAFTPDSTQFVTASYEGGAKVWSATNGAAIRTLGTGQRPFDRIAFSPDGKTLLTWTDETVPWKRTMKITPREIESEGVAHLWNVDTGEEIRSLAIPVMTCVAFSPDGTKIAVGEYGEFRGL